MAGFADVIGWGPDLGPRLKGLLPLSVLDTIGRFMAPGAVGPCWVDTGRAGAIGGRPVTRSTACG